MEERKTRATTLAARFGFQDHELTTPKHDELMVWLDGAMGGIVRELFDGPAATEFWQTTTQERRADELRIGDRVVSSESRILTVTSTRMQGVGAGAVSLGFAELPHRISYRPSDSVLVVAPSIRKAG